MAKIVTATEDYFDKNKISCFLGGGITNCPEWQDEVIEFFRTCDINTDDLVLYNPRRKNFPIDDPTASEKQISWEFYYLNKCDIFSMYFCNTPKSDQPICFYELGRYVTKKVMESYKDSYRDKIFITCEEGFKRVNDVIYQMKLIDPAIRVQLNSNPKNHALAILDMYRNRVNTKSNYQ